MTDGHTRDDLVRAIRVRKLPEQLRRDDLSTMGPESFPGSDYDLPPSSVHGPCSDGGPTVRSRLPSSLTGGLRMWCEARLDVGESKYGATLRVGWSGAREALLEELADAVNYSLALGDGDLAEQLAAILMQQQLHPKARP